MVNLNLNKSILDSKYDANGALDPLNYVKVYFFFTVKLDLKRNYSIIYDANTFFFLYILFAILLLGYNTNI